MRLAVVTADDSWSVPMSTPDLFTITEAAVVLRIGRTTAYELARRDLASGGGEGLGSSVSEGSYGSHELRWSALSAHRSRHP